MLPISNYSSVIYYTSYYSAFITLLCYYHIKLSTRADEAQRQNSTLPFSKVSCNFYVAKEIKQVWSYKFVEILVIQVLLSVGLYCMRLPPFRVTVWEYLLRATALPVLLPCWGPRHNHSALPRKQDETENLTEHSLCPLLFHAAFSSHIHAKSCHYNGTGCKPSD